MSTTKALPAVPNTCVVCSLNLGLQTPLVGKQRNRCARHSNHVYLRRCQRKACNNQFWTQKKKGKYCSRKCKDLDQKVTLRGSGNPNYKHGDLSLDPQGVPLDRQRFRERRRDSLRKRQGTYARYPYLKKEELLIKPSRRKFEPLEPSERIVGRVKRGR